MKSRNPLLRYAVALCMGTAAAQAGAAGYVDLGKTGTPVLKSCNPTNSASQTACKVAGLPGVSGYTLVGSRSTPIVKNDVRVGTLYDKVWRSSSDPNYYIFGMKVTVNTSQWDPSGQAFNVNDLARRLRLHAPASGAYFMDGSTKALLKVGRTNEGLNEYTGTQPDRDNTWVDFRVDANAADPDGTNSPNSPWVLVQTRAPKGYAVNDFGARVLNSDFATVSDSVEVFVPSYQPNGVPPPDDGGDDD